MEDDLGIVCMIAQYCQYYYPCQPNTLLSEHVVLYEQSLGVIHESRIELGNAYHAVLRDGSHGQ